MSNHFDVLIVGAGLSGIGAAYHLQTRCPKKTYAILESRERLGGTWDFFRYPGIRSDSDMHTLGYSFRPWTGEKAIADGPSILEYVRSTAQTYGIDQNIRYRQRIEHAAWSSQTAQWTVTGTHVESGEKLTYTCNFLFMCAGYYDYDGGYTPDFPGRDRFTGTIVHPQKWTDDIQYADKRVVVIGSGATAVTLVPELAKKAAHVTMLQRSPTYIVSVPEADKIANWLRDHLPESTAHAITRWKNVLLGMAIYGYSRRFPNHAKKFFVGNVAKKLKGAGDVRDFTPTYNPWDQRLCLVPNGDLFRAIRSGKADVVTDRIASFTERGLELESGRELDADLVVTATGLKVKLLGGLTVEVDGRRVDPVDTMTYKGLMWSGVPNMALAIGYTNASWTLKCDLTSEYVCRLINYMDAHGYTECVPRPDPNMEKIPLIGLASGYVMRAAGELPSQGKVAPWRLHQNYALDTMLIRRGKLDDGVMEFSTPNGAANEHKNGGPKTVGGRA